MHYSFRAFPLNSFTSCGRVFNCESSLSCTWIKTEVVCSRVQRGTSIRLRFAWYCFARPQYVWFIEGNFTLRGQLIILVCSIESTSAWHQKTVTVASKRAQSNQIEEMSIRQSLLLGIGPYTRDSNFDTANQMKQSSVVLPAANKRVRSVVLCPTHTQTHHGRLSSWAGFDCLPTCGLNIHKAVAVNLIVDTR